MPERIFMVVTGKPCQTGHTLEQLSVHCTGIGHRFGIGTLF